MSRMATTITLDLNETIEKLQAEQRKLRDRGDEIVAKVLAEDREFSDDETRELGEVQARVKQISQRCGALTKHAETRASLEEPGEPRTKRDFKGQRGGSGGGAEDEDDAKAAEREYRAAYNEYLRYGMSGMTAERRELMQQHFSSLPGDHPETRALSALTGNTGGYTVPQGFMGQVEVAMKNFDGVRAAPTFKLATDKGNDLPWPTVNDTNNEGEQVEENQATSEGDVSFGQLMLKAYLFSSKLVLVPIQLLQDTGVDIEALLARLLGERLGRITSKRYTTGNGANQPQGIVTGSTLGKTAAATAAITYDELVDLQHSVDPAYRTATAGFMFNDTTFSILRKLKDQDGRPIWQPAAVSGMAGGAPGTLLGSPYWINQSMASPAASAKSVLFGDMSKYAIRDVRNLTLVRLTERYAERFQVGFFAFLRTDGRVVDAGTNPIKHLIQAAS